MNLNNRVVASKSPNSAFLSQALKLVAAAGLVTTLFHIQSASAQMPASETERPLAYGSPVMYKPGFKRRIYVGVGMGKSWIEPDTSAVAGLDPNRRVNDGGQAMIGFDFSKWFSIEGHASSLGEAGLSPAGSVAYETYGVSGLAYLGKNRHKYNRRGFSAFGRVGYGQMKNEPSDDINFKQVNSMHTLFGAGLEFSTALGLALRAEAIAFDTDARYGQLSLLYRIGKRPRQKRVIAEAPKVDLAPLAPTREVPVVQPAPAVAIVPIDTDYDGVPDFNDSCPTTQEGIAVDASGCAVFNGVIEGVNFNSGSANLTPNARAILGGVVDTLNTYPDIKLTIMAHTDAQGNNDSNKRLSIKRARSVASFLVQRGITTDRLKAYGYGEEQPAASNDTEMGRLKNRRVEFRAK